jgi:hypothetical protein
MQVRKLHMLKKCYFKWAYSSLVSIVSGSYTYILRYVFTASCLLIQAREQLYFWFTVHPLNVRLNFAFRSPRNSQTNWNCTHLYPADRALTAVSGFVQRNERKMILNWKRFARSGWFQRASLAVAWHQLGFVRCQFCRLRYLAQRKLLLYLRFFPFPVTPRKYMEKTFTYTATAFHIKSFPTKSHEVLLNKSRESGYTLRNS